MEIRVDIEQAVFNPVYLPYLDCTARTQIFYGGSGSGKSVFLAQRCVYDLLRGGRNYLIAREISTTVRRSVMNEICKVIADWGVSSLFRINHSNAMITCANGYQILFTGLDDTEKIKSITPEQGVITDIWVEEATETDRRTIKELYKRQRGGSDKIKKRFTLSFNPILRTHWIYQEYFNALGWGDKQTTYSGDGLEILKTTYLDNRFLTAEDRKDLESEKDPYFRSVYTLGNWGILGNVIFTNWSVQDLSGMKAQFTNHRAGLDFGFSSNPAAMPEMHYDTGKKTLYIFGELYETGLTNDLLAVEVKKRIGDKPVTCDSAEPKSITELQKYGVNALSAKKGKDSVVHGIQWLQQQTIIIDNSCINTINEFTQYHWREDKAGNAISQPVDRNNHIIDAIRYGLENDMDDGGAWVMGMG